MAVTPTIGYFNSDGISKQIDAINKEYAFAVEAVRLSSRENLLDLNPDLLWFDYYGGDTFQNEDPIFDWVYNGGSLVLHDSDGNALRSNPDLFGLNLTYENGGGDNLDIYGDNVAKAFAIIDDNYLDGGNSSYHGYWLKDSLPEDATPVLHVGDDPSKAAGFFYEYGEGSIFMTTIPNEYYLDGNGGEEYGKYIDDFSRAVVAN